MNSTSSQRNTMPARVARLARKELRETLRDRRTIVTLVLMPLLVYPLLSIAFQRFVLTTMPTQSEPAFRIGFANEEDARVFIAHLAEGHRLAERADTVSKGRKQTAEPMKLPELGIFVLKNPEEAVERRDVDLGVRLRQREPVDLSLVSTPSMDVELLFDPKLATSREALELVERRLSLLNEQYLRLRLEQAHISKRAHPVEATRVTIDSSGSSISFPLATLVPFVLILTTITGAVYPAIDLTAGERERGTLEMLIAAPIPRMGLLIAKYVAVVTVAMLTALVNCGAMIITVASIGLSTQLFGERGLTAELAIEFCGLLLLFAAFFSAVLLALTSFARSFKEAQAYLVPLMLASTAPGIFTVMNGVRLTPLLAITPLANIVLLARDMFEYNASPFLSFLVLSSTLVYALLAILVAAKLFGSDAVLYGSPGSWSDTFRPSSLNPSTISLGTVLLTLAVVAPVLMLSSNLIARLDVSIATRMGFAALTTLVLFIGAPVFVARWSSTKTVQALRLGKSSWSYYLAGCLLGLSLWPFAHELVLRQHEQGWISLDADKLSRARALLVQLQQIPVSWTLLCVALIPAVAEELFFRGFLLTVLCTRQSARMAVVTSAIIFGAFHVVVMEGMLLERLLPTTFLGLFLGWLAIRSGSIWPGVLLHTVHNGTVILAAHFQKEIAARGWTIDEQSHVPGWWMVAALIVAGTGVLIAYVSSSKDAGSAVSAEP